MAKLFRQGECVGPGEKLTAAYFEQNLPDSWYVICSKELVTDRATREVDFIIIATNVVFVIEEKHWKGAIHGNENGWVLPTGESCTSPLSNCAFIARILAGLLRENNPSIKSKINRPFVFSRVVLSHPEARSFIRDPRASEEVLFLETCKEELERFDGLARLPITEYREQILATLTSLPERPEIPNRMREYEIQEVLPSHGPLRCLGARHDDGTEVVLKLARLPVTAISQRRQEEETALLREYDALRALSGTGLVPDSYPFFRWNDDQYLVFPIRQIPGRSLRSDRTDAPPLRDKVISTLDAAFEALAQLHDQGVVHRALNPDRIHLRADGSICFSDFVIARLPDNRTIAATADEFDPDSGYRAPECKVDMALAVPSSDVYGLAASFIYWITGNEPESDPANFLKDSKADLTDRLNPELAGILLDALTPDERVRPSSQVVRDRIIEVRKCMSSPKSKDSNGVPAEGDVIEQQYRVTRILGEGATAITYLAEDLIAEREYVLKRIKIPEIMGRLGEIEFRALADLVHPNLRRVIDVRPPQAEFHLKLEYVRGSTLREVASRFLRKPRECVHVATEILAALEYLEGRNLLHRDISPSNILVPDEDETGPTKLIDFGLAAFSADAKTAVGTPRYRAPEIDRGEAWSQSCDLYALAVVIFELLTGRLPYEMLDGVPQKHLQTVPTPDEELLGVRLLDCLLKASQPDPGLRFPNARSFAIAMADAIAPGEPVVQGERVVNPVVDNLRRLYRNSRVGNTGARGLDTDFAMTYVQTRLDAEIIPRVLAGEFRLLILSGNPGDGKTAVLQRLLSELQSRGAVRASEDEAGWEYHLDNHVFRAVYDASESNGNLTADQLLHEALGPLAGSTLPDVPYTAAIAVNDGRLLDFFERYGALRYTWLWNQIREGLFGSNEPDPSILLVDLKARSLASIEDVSGSLTARNLAILTDEQFWRDCAPCVARESCPIKFNAAAFSDPQTAVQVLEQLHSLVLVVHLRREHRPTMRDLRSALGYLLTHDLGCKDVHERLERAQTLDVDAAYFNSTFAGVAGDDLLLDEWQSLDPSRAMNPRLDRFIHFNRENAPGFIRSVLVAEGSQRLNWLSLVLQVAPDWQEIAKRWYFFEGDAERGQSLDLPVPNKLFPYQHLDTFLAALRGPVGVESLLSKVIKGISRADGVPDDACGDDLALNISGATTDDVAIVKRFSRAQFQIEVHRYRGPVESIPDHLMLRHSSGSPELEITLDLFELILRSADGLLPGAEEQLTLAEDLASFKHQLLSYPAQEIAIIERGLRSHEIVVSGGRIERR